MINFSSRVVLHITLYTTRLNVQKFYVLPNSLEYEFRKCSYTAVMQELPETLLCGGQEK